jgi:transglutaminase-like putative cysteine protease
MRVLLCFLLLCLIGTSAVAQNSKVKIAPKKAWVEDFVFDKNATPPQGQESSFYYLLLDRQDNIGAQESYVHNAYKLLTSEGVQEMSDLSFSYDGDYEQLIIHKVLIHRNGAVIDKLPGTVRAIQREESMDRFLYDESYTAIINLSDVRVGDIVEYAFTRKGYNPVFKGNYASAIYLNTIGYDKKSYKVIRPASVGLNIKSVNTKTEPEISTNDNFTTYTWTREKVSGYNPDQNLPSWYDPYEYVLVSTYRDWEEIGKWAFELFRVSDADKTRIASEADKLFGTNDIDEFALKAIRFVQDDIRYLGFETGLNSYQPHSPTKVLDQRFGDCKDKSLLLCTMLQSKGIEAYPVLVNTSTADKTKELLPAATDFDHCVVTFRLGTEDYYIDPTINNQGGTLRNIYFPRYGEGLVVDGKTFLLKNLVNKVASSTKEVQTFELDSINGSATFDIETTYIGRSADYQRMDFSGTDLEGTQKSYLNYYAETYPGIERRAQISLEDNRAENKLIVREKYRIPKFWYPQEDSTQGIFCKVKAQTLGTYFNVDKSAERTGPYALTYPLDFYHEIRVKLPIDWTVTPEKKTIDKTPYSYSYDASYADRQFTLKMHYTTKMNAVPVESMAEFEKDHDVMESNLSYFFNYTPGAESIAANAPLWPGLLAMTVFIGLAAVGCFIIYTKYDPSGFYPAAWAKPIEGVLILPALGVVFGPIRHVAGLVKEPVLFNGTGWVGHFMSSSYGLGVLAFAEQLYNVTLLVFSVFMIIMFFKRRSSVPRLMIIYYVVPVIFLLADGVAAGMLAPEYDMFQDSAAIFVQIVGAAIWIPYFIRSQRVKRTFVIRYNNDDTGALKPEMVTVSTQEQVNVSS